VGADGPVERAIGKGAAQVTAWPKAKRNGHHATSNTPYSAVLRDQQAVRVAICALGFGICNLGSRCPL
jgi:hypothetical protein